MDTSKKTLFFMVSLMSICNAKGMSAAEFALLPTDHQEYSPPLVHPSLKVSIAETQEEIEQPQPVTLTHQEIQTLVQKTIKLDTIKKWGHKSLIGLSACMACSGNYVYALGTALSAACIKAPQQVDAVTTQAALLGSQVCKTAYIKAKPHVQHVVQKINKENCGRAMHRCPNTCQKLTSLLTFGYYQPEEQIKLRTRKKSK